MAPAGRLTLSWVGKDRALLGTEGGGYEWVERDEPRVTEVRLLHEAEAIGEVGPEPDAVADNLLIVGDSYDALRSLTRVPEYAAEYRGKIKLVYIDPPFNTGQAFEHYDDALEHSVWLTMMRDRLLLIRELRLIPVAAIGLAPHDTTLVNIETVVWVDAPARRTLAPITLLGHRVGITLTLARVDYGFGDGTSETRADSGTPYDEQRAPCHTPQCPGYFGHTYRVTGRMTITGTAAWTATFTVDGGNRVAIPGILTGPQASATILVRQARGVLVPN